MRVRNKQVGYRKGILIVLKAISFMAVLLLYRSPLSPLKYAIKPKTRRSLSNQNPALASVSPAVAKLKVSVARVSGSDLKQSSFGNARVAGPFGGALGLMHRTAFGPFVESRFFGLLGRFLWRAPELTTLMSMLYRLRMAVNLGGMLERLIPSCFATFSASTWNEVRRVTFFVTRKFGKPGSARQSFGWQR